MKKRQKELVTLIISVLVLVIIILVFYGLRGDKNHMEAIAEQNDLTPNSSSAVIGENEDVPEPTNTQSHKTSPTPSPEEIYNNEFIVPVEGARPFAVMIDNEGLKSLPQGGLYMAQTIYETVVEGGETRLMPVFWNVKPNMIGPVRSSRHYFLDYAMEHDAIYVHIGWSPMAQDDISVFKINNINGVVEGWSVFYELTKDINNWQDTYTDIDKISDFAGSKKYRMDTEHETVFSYNKTNITPDDGEKAEKISIRYSGSYTCGFEYDEMEKTYKRLRKGEPHMERITGEQLKAKNIIIQKVKIYDIKGDTEGRQEVVTVGSGKATLITCGKAVTINWSKAERTSKTEYTYKNGDELVLNPGQTWIQIIPEYGEVTIE